MAFRAALLLAAAGIGVAGCGRTTEPVASHPATGTLGGSEGENRPVPGGAEPAVSPSDAGSPAVAEGGPTALSAPASPAAAITVAPEELAEIDRFLADFDLQLIDAGQDAATPEGDLE